MPPPPEFPDGAGEVGGAEVLHEVEAHDLGAAQGHVGVGGEVAVDLDGEGGGGGRHLEPAEAVRGGVDGGDQQPQPVGDDQLLEGTPQEAQQAPAEALPAEGGGPAELGQQAARPADGAGEQVGEIGQEEGQVQEGALRRTIPAVDVDEIARGHKEVEGEAGGEEQVQRGGGEGQPGGGEEPLQQPQGEAQVFEEEQGPEEEDQEDGQDGLPAAALRPVQEPGAQVGDHGGGQEGEQVLRPAAQEEPPAGAQQPGPPPGGGQQEPDQGDQGEEEEETGGEEAHGADTFFRQGSAPGKMARRRMIPSILPDKPANGKGMPHGRREHGIP